MCDEKLEVVAVLVVAPDRERHTYVNVVMSF